jgi:hypothetical protein
MISLSITVLLPVNPRSNVRSVGGQLTRTTPRGKPLTTKIYAVLVCLNGSSMNRIACLVRVSAPSVLNCLRACAIEHSEKPERAGSRRAVARDDVGHLRCQRHPLDGMDSLAARDVPLAEYAHLPSLGAE